MDLGAMFSLYHECFPREVLMSEVSRDFENPLAVDGLRALLHEVIMDRFAWRMIAIDALQ